MRKVVCSKWFIAIGPILVSLLVMPANSPIPLPRPSFTKPLFAVGVIIVLLIIWTSHIGETR